MHKQQAYNLYYQQLYKLYYQLVYLHYYQFNRLLNLTVTQVILPNETPADDADNPKTTNSYDAAGRLVTVTDALGNSELNGSVPFRVKYILIYLA